MKITNGLASVFAFVAIQFCERLFSENATNVVNSFGVEQ